jgi:hypothetical protein
MEFDLFDYVHDWREHRLYFYDDNQKLHSIPTSWTDFLPKDSFAEISAGRSFLRFDDLLVLVDKVKTFKKQKGIYVK